MSHRSLGRLLATVAMALLVGCVYSSATPIKGPDDQPGWFRIWCKVEKAECDKRAAEVCPHGYVVADLNETVSTGYGHYKSAYVNDFYRAYMWIKCKVPEGAAAVGDGGDDGG